MKIRTKCLLLGVLTIPVVIYAANTFDNVSVGSSANSNQATGHSAAVGTGNYSYFRSLTVGGGNRANEYSLSVGAANDARDLSSAIGMANSVNKAPGQYPRRALAVGYGNVVEASDAVALGRSNVQTGYSGAVIGWKIDNSADMATVVGGYNIDRPGVRFVVGNGVDPDLVFGSGEPTNGPQPAVRSNALEVYEDGRIIIGESQGDVPMGEYGS